MVLADWDRARAIDAVRPFLREDIRTADAAQVEAIVDDALAGLTREQIEGFWDTVLSVGQKALPGIIQGALAGSAAGPWGALVGGLAGGATSIFGGTSQAPKAPPAAPAVPPAPMPSPPTQPIGGAAAVPQLLQLLQSPQLQQALVSLLLGSAGSSAVPVGNGRTSAPPSAFLNLLGTLTGAAAGQAAQAARPEVAESYMLDSRGSILGDPGSPEGRAAALWAQLESTPSFRRRGAPLGGRVREDAVTWLNQSGAGHEPLPVFGVADLEA